MLSLVVAGTAMAQKDSTHRWPAKDREDFITECVKSALPIGEDSAKRYCSCMLSKIENLYPNPEDAGKLTKAEMQKPEMQKMVKDCLQMKWSETDRQDFLTSCQESAAALGKEKAKKYCSCMLGKMEVKFVTAEDAGGLTPEELQKPEWQKLVKGCLQ